MADGLRGFIRVVLCFVASTAVTPTLIPISIEQVIRMSFRTMRFPRIPSNPGDTSQSIFPMIHKFQMSGINAASIAAKVVNLKANPNRTKKQLVSESMDFEILPSETERPITFRKRALPFPTTIRLQDTSPETLLGRMKSWFSSNRVTVVLPSFIMGTTPMAGQCWLQASFYRASWIKKWRSFTQRVSIAAKAHIMHTTKALSIIGVFTTFYRTQLWWHILGGHILSPTNYYTTIGGNK